MGDGSAERVFVSYRRDDTRHLVGRLRDRLSDHIGSDRVFLDVESIPAGVDFTEVIDEELETCAVMLVVIGPGWLDTATEGQRRLDDPDDFIALEIRTALARDIRVIPVLADGATMPTTDDLPAGLASLARRAAVRVDHETFRSDVDNLLRELDTFLDSARHQATQTYTKLFSRRYELQEAIGYGTMSEVYRGRDKRLDRMVAVKLLRADMAHDSLWRDRFREALDVVVLRHPTVVEVYDTYPNDAGTASDGDRPRPCIVMEFVDGRTLREIIKQDGAVPEHRAMEIITKVCDALHFAHSKGIVHRDIKPSNVMITATGVVKTMDFGIAKLLVSGDTATTALFKSAQYLSPEQVRGEAVDARSDVYAAGCVLFEMLSGEPAFTGDSPVDVAYKHVQDNPGPPSTRGRPVSTELDTIVLKAMAKHPADRYQSAAELRDAVMRLPSERSARTPGSSVRKRSIR